MESPIPAVAKFQKYLRINTAHPNPDYDAAKTFLLKQAREIGLPYQVLYAVEGKPIIVISWEGTQPTLPSVLLNSHVDVVQANTENWTHDPYSAHIDKNGDIHARGTQDMKSVGIQYLEAIRILKNNSTRLARTLHMSFVPDEEIGGIDGMEAFIKMPEFKNLNVGFALDEGIAVPSEAYTVFNAERSQWWIEVVCNGNTGHGSKFIEGDAGSKLRKVLDSFMNFRDQEEESLKLFPNLKLGDTVTTNLTKISGGTALNVLPDKLYAYFDMRIAPTVDLDALELLVKQWCEDAGEDVELNFLQKVVSDEITPVNPDNKWWKAFSSACEKQNMKIEVEIFPACTDSTYLRAEGIPALGFSPMNFTKSKLHEDNEFLNQEIFLSGIQHYTAILTSLGNAPE